MAEDGDSESVCLDGFRVELGESAQSARRQSLGRPLMFVELPACLHLPAR